MAKQPKSARADSSAGQSAAAVSSNTDALAAAEPATPKAPDATDGLWNEARPPVPSLGHTRRSTEVRDETGATVVRRVRCYLLPSLEQAREAFEDLLGQRVPWPGEIGGSNADCGLQEQPYWVTTTWGCWVDDGQGRIHDCESGN